MPARPVRHRLISDFCSSARRFVSRFLQTFPRGRALAVPLGPCDQVPGGLSPPGQRPCWAYTRTARSSLSGPPHETGGRRPALARCLQPQPPRYAPGNAGDEARKKSGIGRRVQPTNPHRTCQVQIVFLTTSSSSRPSSSCPSSFRPSSSPWNNHLLDLLDTMRRIHRTPPGRSRRPRSMRSALRRHGAPECSVTPCKLDEAPCVPSYWKWRRSALYLAVKMWIVHAK